MESLRKYVGIVRVALLAAAAAPLAAYALVAAFCGPEYDPYS